MFYSPIKTLILIRKNLNVEISTLGSRIALAKAYVIGFIIEGLIDGIEKVYHLYEVVLVVNE